MPNVYKLWKALTPWALRTRLGLCRGSCTCKIDSVVLFIYLYWLLLMAIYRWNMWVTSCLWVIYNFIVYVYVGVCKWWQRQCILTPWSRALLEKPTGSQLVKKFPAFYETRRFITAFKRARNLSVSSASSIQSMSPTSHFLMIHFHIILPSNPRSPKWSLSLRFPHRNPVYASPIPHTCNTVHRMNNIKSTFLRLLIKVLSVLSVS